MASKRATFSLNPAWSHYVASAAFVCAAAFGFFRYFILDRVDPLHCHALLSGGSWLDDKFANWQPDGCMIYQYKADDAATCLASQQVVFIGDSVTRQLYFQFIYSLDPSLPASPPDDEHKHVDYRYTTAHNTDLLFYWDPFLNTSAAQTYIHALPPDSPSNEPPARPALLVVGSGLWYLRYASSSGGLPAWVSTIETALQSITRAQGQIADAVVILPVENVVPSKLSPDRAATMDASDIDAMNSDLVHRIRPPSSTDPFSFFPPSGAQSSKSVFIPSVFNQMLDSSQTEDGLHFSNSIVKMQATVLMNLRCNEVMPKSFPLDKTCCRSYPWPKPLHFLVLTVFLLWGPVALFLARRYNARPIDQSLIPKEQLPIVIISAAVAVIYVADRTGFWLKEQKQFSPWTFAFLCFLSLGIGLLTTKRADKDLGFLNRDQTDEWKGWMQIAILIYHYIGASKISGVYNPIRVLVASYLFMTGYGHTTFYIKKADFGFLRVAQVLVRLNLFTLVLAYAMNTDYISYYFSPLVSWWYLVIYFTMLPGSKFNERATFLILKIALSMAMMTTFMQTDWLLKTIFSFLEKVCGIHWSAREWAFRVNLDIWIVYVGMVAAVVVIKVRELHLPEHPLWPLCTKVAAGVSVLILIWYFTFELSMDKFQYNIYQPLVSFLPVGAFVVLRNANAVLRSASSTAFAFVGRCSLETFIIQYHLWLAGDTKGILLVIPGTKWRPLNMVLTTIIFIYVSHHVSRATGEITKWICDEPKPSPSLPPPVNAPNPPEAGPSSNVEVQEVIFEASEGLELPVRKDNEGNELPREPDTPVRLPRRWVDRLAEGTSSPSNTTGLHLWYGGREWRPGVKTKLSIGLAIMWVLNVLWSYPP